MLLDDPLSTTEHVSSLLFVTSALSAVLSTTSNPLPAYNDLQLSPPLHIFPLHSDRVTSPSVSASFSCGYPLPFVRDAPRASGTCRRAQDASSRPAGDEAGSVSSTWPQQRHLVRRWEPHRAAVEQTPDRPLSQAHAGGGSSGADSPTGNEGGRTRRQADTPRTITRFRRPLNCLVSDPRRP
jgi:hypothetical protein